MEAVGEGLELLLFAIVGQAGVEQVVSEIEFSMCDGLSNEGEVFVTYDLCGGFSGTTSTVPSSCWKYRAGVQYADLSSSTPQLVHFELRRSSELDVGLNALPPLIECTWSPAEPKFMRGSMRASPVEPSHSRRQNAWTLKIEPAKIVAADMIRTMLILVSAGILNLLGVEPVW